MRIRNSTSPLGWLNQNHICEKIASYLILENVVVTNQEIKKTSLMGNENTCFRDLSRSHCHLIVTAKHKLCSSWDWKVYCLADMQKHPSSLAVLVEDLQKLAEIHKSVWFCPLTEILTWKSAGGRISTFCMSDPNIDGPRQWSVSKNRQEK